MRRVLVVVSVVVTSVVAGTGVSAAGVATFSSSPVPSWRVDGVGRATLLVGDTVYVGGSFGKVTSPDGASTADRANLAAFSASTGALKGTFRADTDGAVRALAFDGVNLYVGGSFVTVGGVSRSRLAALDPASGAVRSTWKANASSHVYALTIASGKLYVGGAFSWIKGVARSRVAALTLADASLTSFQPAVDATVNAVAAAGDGSAVYLGGAFTTVNGQAQSTLAKLRSDGSRVPMTWAGLDGPALDLRVTGDGSRLGAAVAGAGNQGAWYDTSTGTRYWRQRCDGDAQAVHVVADSMFTGFHEGCDGDTTTRLTSNDVRGGGRDSTFKPSFDQFWGVWDISGDTSALVIAGDFTKVSGVPVQGFAIFRARG